MPHADLNCVHGPLKNHLLLFDLLVHEITAEEENYLWVECLLTDFFDKASQFIHFYLVAIAILCLELLLDTTIVKNYLAGRYLEKDVSSRFPWILSH